MASSVGILTRITNLLDKRAFLQNKGWFGRNILETGKKDYFEITAQRFLNSKTAAKQSGSWISRLYNRGFLFLVPQRYHQSVGNALLRLDKWPRIAGLSNFVKTNLLFEVPFAMYRAARDLVMGCYKTEGGIVDKFIGGIKSLGKSVIRSISGLGANAAAALAVPALLGVSLLGPAGIILGSIAGMVAQHFTFKGFDTLMSTHGHAEAQNPPFYVNPDLPHGVQSVLQQIHGGRSRLQPNNPFEGLPY